jgi:hypothetical protein
MIPFVAARCSCVAGGGADLDKFFDGADATTLGGEAAGKQKKKNAKPNVYLTGQAQLDAEAEAEAAGAGEGGGGGGGGGATEAGDKNKPKKKLKQVGGSRRKRLCI